MTAWDARIDRARSLARAFEPAAAMLDFYAGLAGCQGALASRQPPSSRAAGSFSGRIDLDAAAEGAPVLVDWVRAAGPARLAAACEDAASLSIDEWRELMQQRLAHLEIGEPLGFFVDAALQPFAELAAAIEAGQPAPGVLPGASAGELAERGEPSRCCPVCGSGPVVATLREEGHGARRTLVCSLCLTEWAFARVVCPACDERRFDALPVYSSEQVPHLRVDACDSCRAYVKTVDLTKDGLAVPIVDDLATVSLDLWAREAGYHRLRPNLLRL